MALCWRLVYPWTSPSWLLLHPWTSPSWLLLRSPAQLCSPAVLCLVFHLIPCACSYLSPHIHTDCCFSSSPNPGMASQSSLLVLIISSRCAWFRENFYQEGLTLLEGLHCSRAWALHFGLSLNVSEEALHSHEPLQQALPPSPVGDKGKRYLLLIVSSSVLFVGP